jgi:hypothetical protein
LTMEPLHPQLCYRHLLEGVARYKNRNQDCHIQEGIRLHGHRQRCRTGND